MTDNYHASYDGYAERVRASLSSQPLMSRLLGAEALTIMPGRVELVLDVGPDLLQPHGNVHGVVASALADSAAGYAAQTLLAEGADVVTVEYKINFLAPGIGKRIRAVGEVLRAGRTLQICAADVYAEQDGRTRHFAHMVATMMAVES
ncbi:MAG: PaaI family thioesterase [Gammaproteobacteria bacterium]